MIDRFLCRQLLHACSFDQALYFPYGRIAFLQSVMRWRKEAINSESIPLTDIRYPITVILQSYKRPWNIEPMVRMFLRFPWVEKVIVSNNNPTTVFRLPFTDPRVTVINQPHRYPASMFAVLALQEAKNGAQYFLCIDDDLLLFPAQIETLIRSLIADSSVPHGLVGQRIADSGHSLEQHITGDGSVDVINRAYAFTADHLRRYQAMLDQLGYATDEEKAQLPFGSDIVLSKSGAEKPRIHDVGPLLSCPTSAKPGIARFTDVGFTEFRADLIRKLS